MLDKLRQRFHRKKSDSDPLAFEVIYPKEVKAPRPGSNYRGSSLDFDWVVIATVCILIGIGTVMVYSASVSLADSPKYGTTSTYFLIRHIAALVVGAIAAFFVYHVPMRVWEKMAKPIGIISVILLILVLVPGIGVSVNGSRRWIRFPVFNLQVSEVTKLAAVIFTSWFTVTRQEYMHSFRKGFIPMLAVMGIVTALLALQPDLGATVVVLAIIMGILFLGGISYVILGVVGSVSYTHLTLPTKA